MLLDDDTEIRLARGLTYAEVNWAVMHIHCIVCIFEDENKRMSAYETKDVPGCIERILTKYPDRKLVALLQTPSLKDGLALVRAIRISEIIRCNGMGRNLEKLEQFTKEAAEKKLAHP